MDISAAAQNSSKGAGKGLGGGGGHKDLCPEMRGSLLGSWCVLAWEPPKQRMKDG